MATAQLTLSESGSPEPGAARRRSRYVLGLVAAVLVLLVVVVLSIAVGAKQIPFGTVWDALFHFDGSDDQVVVRTLRLPRTILGVLVGAAMALAGALMQALTRNPLADPGLLGVNAGAALAVVASISWLGVGSLTGYVWAALLGAGVATVVVYVLGSAGRSGVSPVRLALAGTAVGAAFTGMISAIVILDRTAFDGFRAWSVGSLAGRDFDVVWQVLPFMVVGFVIALAMAGPLNALSLGDDTARALGAKVSRIRLAGVLAVTLLCGAGTAAVGVIGFVGLVVPHLVRGFTGPNQRWLLPYSLVLGPILLLVSDVVGRVVLRPGELQASVVTAAIGAPFFIMLVRRRRLSQL
jgi:iron complex transport system permease protein